jgi:hypothetical protein
VSAHNPFTDKSLDYEERLRELGHTTLEERRHQLDMQQVHRILVGKDKVKSETWFNMASDIESDQSSSGSTEPKDPGTAPRGEKELFLTKSAGKLE